jgi:hypothetical protein
VLGLPIEFAAATAADTRSAEAKDVGPHRPATRSAGAQRLNDGPDRRATWEHPPCRKGRCRSFRRPGTLLVPGSGTRHRQHPRRARCTMSP